MRRDARSHGEQLGLGVGAQERSEGKHQLPQTPTAGDFSLLTHSCTSLLDK